MNFAEVKSPLVVLGAGAAAIALSSAAPEKYRGPLRIGGWIAAGVGAVQLVLAFVSSGRSLADGVADFVGISPGKPELKGIVQLRPIDPLRQGVPNSQGIAGRWLTPGKNQKVFRNRLLGDEYSIAFEVENHASAERALAIEVAVLEDDLPIFGGDSSSTTLLGLLVVPAGQVALVDARLVVGQFNNPFGLDVTATLQADGQDLASVAYRLS